MGYTRELGHGGVRLLLESAPGLLGGVMVTLQDGNLVPIPFSEMIDPQTNSTRIRRVDLNSYSYHVARAYMIRLERSDLESPKMLDALARVAKVTPDEFRERFEPIVSMNPRPDKVAEVLPQMAGAIGVSTQPEVEPDL
jgi:6-phosphofructokinase 1